MRTRWALVVALPVEPCDYWFPRLFGTLRDAVLAAAWHQEMLSATCTIIECFSDWRETNGLA